MAEEDKPNLDAILKAVEARKYFPDSQEQYIRMIVRDETKDFVPRKIIAEERQEFFMQMFDKLGIPVDPDHIAETSKSFRRWLFWNEIFSKLQVAGLIGFGMAAIGWVLKYFGVHIPLPPGGEN